ncbi:MAG: ammonium transporter [Thermomicrobiales bacterium]|nr:ammonium transporter [Thermomicrobiales bacterium]MCO5224685.1 ammonium transporter [Thermomicrobiales bacterium]MCO5226659.1 ammonium transporter [Thermomicrobiales bacterium]
MEINAGDTAFVLMAAALVMIMTPALGFFYGGLVSRKNVLSTLMHSFFTFCLVSVVWVLWGYTFAFGDDRGGIIGGLEHFGLRGIGQEPGPFADNIPGLAFVAFQMMFACITPALITGAFAERKSFKAYLVFTLAWVTFVYAPLCHWVWGGGWIGEMGALDFAGGTVIHISSGVAAVVAARMLGQRKDFGKPETDPHDLTMTVLGASLLWFGWFGFNAGSALAADGLAAHAFVVTNVAAAMGAISWMGVSWWRQGHPSVLGAACGAVAGLVGITPAAGFVTPMAAIIIGLGAGVFCFFAVDLLKHVIKLDDALDVFAVHGVGGIWGALATGLFATTAVNAGAADGLFNGNAEQLWIQFVAVVAAIAFAGTVTFVILKVIDMTIGLRVQEEEEVLGLDTTQHGELAYRL